MEFNTATPPLNNDLHVQGTWFGGKLAGLQWLAREFYAYRDTWMRKGHFVGDDQLVMKGAVALNWRHVMVFDYRDKPEECVEDKWFLLRHWLASRDEGDPKCKGMEPRMLAKRGTGSEEKKN